MAEQVRVELFDFSTTPSQQGWELNKFLQERFRKKKPTGASFAYSTFRKINTISTRRWKRRFIANSFAICKSLNCILMLSSNNTVYVYSLKSKRYLNRFPLFPFGYNLGGPPLHFKVVEREQDPNNQAHIIVLLSDSFNGKLEIHKINLDTLMKERSRMKNRNTRILDSYASNLVWKIEKNIPKTNGTATMLFVPNREFENVEKGDAAILIYFTNQKNILDCFSYKYGKQLSSITVPDTISSSSTVLHLAVSGSNLIFYRYNSADFVDQRMNVIQSLKTNIICIGSAVIYEPNSNVFITQQSSKIMAFQYRDDNLSVVGSRKLRVKGKTIDWSMMHFNDSNGELLVLHRNEKLLTFK
ncbi:predicted protein [Naegleria gruberi]|uniref:Predicted protein n=1 Tax=Naegleria gruberi TaxID=5762 RepID=D2VZS2_NAEGR|nr:uncharacterized protein NAEGRDRAFT_53577 [Naegleria gruberi]EFC37708.1 predicted protein [Naegleria gruberi]|eukprot:XP_002670452.1 predicted protein [Naegleria gruberi strain NEG-M]